ncbi:MAG: hypothetical protein ABIN57_10535 [Chitinophagaceae bacterium]
MKRLLFKKRTTYLPIEQKPLPSLPFCLLMDFLGFAFVAIPLIGPFVEMLFAPISAFIYFRTFGGGKRGLLGGMFNFFEELIPGLDLIPTFTITWFMQYAKRNKQVIQLQPTRR